MSPVCIDDLHNPTKTHTSPEFCQTVKGSCYVFSLLLNCEIIVSTMPSVVPGMHYQ